MVLLFRGMFLDVGFVRILLAAFNGPGRGLEIVTIVADPHFDFPTMEVYEEALWTGFRHGFHGVFMDFQ